MIQLKLAYRCEKRWEEMPGDDLVRHCDHCDHQVYNLTAMSREEATAFVSEKEGRVCAMLWQRPDGTVVASDCGDRLKTMGILME